MSGPEIPPHILSETFSERILNRCVSDRCCCTHTDKSINGYISKKCFFVDQNGELQLCGVMHTWTHSFVHQIIQMNIYIVHSFSSIYFIFINKMHATVFFLRVNNITCWSNTYKCIITGKKHDDQWKCDELCWSTEAVTSLFRNS